MKCFKDSMVEERVESGLRTVVTESHG